MLNPSTLDN